MFGRKAAVRCYARCNLAENWCRWSASFAPAGPPNARRRFHPNRPDPRPNRLEREESQLWRWALGLIVLFAAAVAALSWQQLKDLPYRLWAIPVGLFVLSVLFAAYAFGRKREVSELKQILKGFQNRAGRDALRRATGSTRPDDLAFAAQLQGTDRLAG